MQQTFIKKIILFLFIFSSTFIFSQDTLSKASIIDKQTKLRSLEQSRWEKLVTNKVFSLYFHISSIGSSDFFDVRIIRNDGETFNIENGQRLVFKLPEGDSLSLINPKNEYSCIGCGAVTLAVGGNNSGIEVSYMISKDELSKLEVNMAKKIIVYTTKEKVESLLTAKDNEKILKAIIATQDL